MRGAELPFDVPDDLPYDALYVSDPVERHTFECEMAVANTWPDRRGEHACTSPAKFRATFPPTGRTWNVCGTHRRVLERLDPGNNRWEMEPLPEMMTTS